MSESNVSDRVYFRGKTLENVIRMINERLKPDLVIHNGNIVDAGIERYYERAHEYYQQEVTPQKLVIPGHNDITYLGYELFQEYFGEPEVLELGDIVVIPVLSAQYETPIGVVGRMGQKKLRETLKEYEGKFRIVAMHHNVIPIPKSREIGFLEDAGDVLKVLTNEGTELVLTGHGGNAYGVKIERTPIVNAGSVSWELHRNPFGNSFNLIDIYTDMVVRTPARAPRGALGFS